MVADYYDIVVFFGEYDGILKGKPSVCHTAIIIAPLATQAALGLSTAKTVEVLFLCGQIHANKCVIPDSCRCDRFTPINNA